MSSVGDDAETRSHTGSARSEDDDDAQMDELEDDFLHAAGEGDVKETQILIGEADKLKLLQDDYFVTVLWDAIAKTVLAPTPGGAGVAKLLLNHVDVKMEDKNGYSLEHKVAMTSGTSQVEVMRVLLDNGGRVDTCNPETRETPLHVASTAEIAQLLLKKGADVNAVNKSGETPVQSAQRKSNKTVLLSLTGGGASGQASDTERETSAGMSTGRQSVSLRRAMTGTCLTLPKYEPNYLDASPTMRWADWCDNHGAPKLGRYLAAYHLLLRQMTGAGESAVSFSEVIKLAQKPTAEQPELMDLLTKKARLQAQIDAVDDEMARENGTFVTARGLRDPNTDNEEFLKELFAQYDRDRSGTIDAEELQWLSVECGEPLSEKEATDVLKIIDENHSGKISFDEFQKWWNSDYEPTGKTLLQVRAIQAKMKAASVERNLQRMFSQANRANSGMTSESGLPEKRKIKKSNTTKFAVEIKLGEYGERKTKEKDMAFVHIAREMVKESQSRAAMNLAKAPKECVSMVSLVLNIRPGVSDVEAGEIVGSLKTVMAATLKRSLGEALYHGSEVKLASRKGQKQVSVDIYFNKDIRAHALNKLGVDYQPGSVKKLECRVSFDSDVSGFIKGGDARIDEFSNAKIDMSVVFEKQAYKQFVVFLKALQPHEMHLDSLLYLTALREVSVKAKFHNLVELIEEFIMNLPTAVFAGWPRNEVGDKAATVDKESKGTVQDATRRIKSELVGNMHLSGSHVRLALGRMVPAVMAMLSDPEVHVTSAPWFMVPLLQVFKEENLTTDIQGIFTDRLAGVTSLTFIMPQEKYTISCHGLDFLQMLPSADGVNRNAAAAAAKKDK